MLSKSPPLNDILASVRRINQGLQVMLGEEREDLLQAWTRSAPTSSSARSSWSSSRCESAGAGAPDEGPDRPRDRQLGVVSEATVRTQVKSILAKLEVTSQLAAVGLAHQVGWSRRSTSDPRG